MLVAYYMWRLLVLGVIWRVPSVFTTAHHTKFEFFNKHSNWSEAASSCKSNKGFLARIDDTDGLRDIKEQYMYNGVVLKHWTDLKYKDNSWKWSDGTNPRRDANFSKVVPVSLMPQGISEYCFLVTNETKLEVENCTEIHAFACDLTNAATVELISTSATTTQVSCPSTVTITTPSCLEASALSTEALATAAVSLSTAHLTSSVTSPLPPSVPTSNVSPTSPSAAEEQMNRYLVRIKSLDVSNQDSLQKAVNDTSRLLSRFEEGALDRNRVNVLLAAQQFEEFGVRYARRYLNTSSTASILKRAEHIEVILQKVKADKNLTVTISFAQKGSSHSADERDEITLPATLFRGRENVIVSVIYEDIHDLVPEGSTSFLDGKTSKTGQLQTRVMACSIEPEPSQVLNENITITFTRIEKKQDEDKSRCVYWDFSSRSKYDGSWSTKGCSLVQKNINQIVCSCNHLTHFAVLMQIGEKTIGAKHQMALEVITYIGCGLSLIGETLTVLAYVVLMNLKQEQCQIRLNLVIAIAIAQIMFLSGIQATTYKEACIFVAVSIHYFYLAGFSWMLIEGVYLYLMVVKVFNTFVKMKLFYSICWGFPLLLVVMSLVIASKMEQGVMSYIHSDFCWVSFANNLVWTFAAPVLLVCTVNAVILGRVVCEITKMQVTKMSDVATAKHGLRACIVLFPLLGFTWVFGILSVTDAGLAFQYIFTIFNSLQGFFIFVMHVLRSSDVRTAYHRKRQKWELSRNTNLPSSRSIIEQSAVFSGKLAMKKVASTESVDIVSRRNQVSPTRLNQERIDTVESCLTPVYT